MLRLDIEGRIDPLLLRIQHRDILLEHLLFLMICEMQVLEHILRTRQDVGPLPDQLVAALRVSVCDPPGQGEDLLPLVEGIPDGDEGAGFFTGFEDEHGICEAGDDAVPACELLSDRRRIQRKLRDRATAILEDLVVE